MPYRDLLFFPVPIHQSLHSLIFNFEHAHRKSTDSLNTGYSCWLLDRFTDFCKIQLLLEAYPGTELSQQREMKTHWASTSERLRNEHPVSLLLSFQALSYNCKE